MTELGQPLQPISSAEEMQGIFDEGQNLLTHQEAIHDGIEDVIIQPEEWDWAVKYAEYYDFMSADWLTKYSRFSYKEASAVVEELQSQGHLSKQYDTEQGGFLVIKDESTRNRDIRETKLPNQTVEQDSSQRRFRKVASALGKLVPQEVKKQSAEFMGGRYHAARNMSGVAALSERRDANQSFQQKNEYVVQRDTDWEASRKWNLILGTRPPRETREQNPDSSGRQNTSPNSADYFDANRLAQLQRDMDQAVKDSVHDAKDRLGVEKLPQDDFKRLAREARRRVLREYVGPDASDDLMGSVEAARRAQNEAARNAAQSSGSNENRTREKNTERDQAGRRTDHANNTSRQAGPDNRTRDTTGSPRQENQAAGERTQEAPRGAESKTERAQDNYEAGLMYLLGKYTKSPPPVMSPASLASRYVREFGLDKPGIESGLDKDSARRQAEDEVMPQAMKHFLTMQQRELIAVDSVKLDFDDPSKISGHKVTADIAKIKSELDQYRQYRG